MQTVSCGWVAHDALQCKLSAVVGLHMTHSKANCQLWLGCILHSNANAWLWLGCIGCTPMQVFILFWLHMMRSNTNFQLWLGCIGCTPMQTVSCCGVAYGALQCKLSAVVRLHMMHSNANCQPWLGIGLGLVHTNLLYLLSSWFHMVHNNANFNLWSLLSRLRHF